MRKATWTKKRYGLKRHTAKYITVNGKRLFIIFSNLTGAPEDWYESAADAKLDGWEKTL